METRTLDHEVLAGRYRLGPRLGRGGMADVHQGLDLRLDRPVAVKLLRPEMAAHAEVRLRFEEEARWAARLSHPNAVAVYDTGEDGGRPFIVMEQLPGESLADRIRGGPAGEAWTLGVARDVLGALAAAHAASLVHRDVKPGNILIAADGHAKVADFGIAKSVEAVGGAQLDVTAANVLVGTPAYLAPERLDGAPATPQSDLWALGAVLFECLAGVKPFPAATPIAVAAAIQSGVPLSLRQLRPDVSPGVVSALERAMAPRPGDRFATAEAMAEALGVAPLTDGRWQSSGAGAGEAVGAAATLVKADRPPAADGGALAAAEAQADTRSDARPDTRVDTRLGPEAAAASLDGVGAGAGGRHGSRFLGATAVVLAMLALALLGLVLVAGGRRGARSTVGASPRLSGELRAVAARVRASGPAGGPRRAEAAGRLDDVAAAVDGGGGAPEAQALVSDVESWQAGGELSAPWVGQALGVLAQVPGVTLAPPPTPPSTDLVVPPDENGRGHGNGNGNGNHGGGGD